MKIAISYPPLQSKKGVPTLSQNRQFQWFKNPTYIYPIVLASAATLLKNNGYEVFWDDAIAEELNFDQWLSRIVREKPDLILIETKTPVIEKHWKIINDLKKRSTLYATHFALTGDHVTVFPEESFQNSAVDYIIAHGDWDFGLLNLVNHLAKGEKLEGGVHFRDENDNITSSGPADISRHNLNSLSLIDRELTRWKLYGYKNGNFKLKPGAYIMSGRDCWWGKCSFCAWTILFPGEKYRSQNPEKSLDEVGNLIQLGAREIMEDSGTLPGGEWLEEFCQGMIDRGYAKKVKISCNMRLNAVKNPETWKLMKQAGFRMVLFGLESANQETLDKVNKGLKIEEVEPALEKCKKAGLEPHLTVMVGYPWEKKEDIQKTYAFIKNLVRKNLLASLQATLIVPYPGTLFYNYCRDNNLLITNHYADYDQSRQVIKTGLSDAQMKKMIQKFYWLFLSPRHVIQRIISIRSWNDLQFLFRAGVKVIFS